MNARQKKKQEGSEPLVLPIKRKWFDMIRKGIKLEDYREIKPYYDTRLMNAFGSILVNGQIMHGKDVPEEIRKEWPVPVIFRNGYGGNSPQITAFCNLKMGNGKTEWGAEPGKKYYILEIEGIAERRQQQCRD